MTPMPTPPALEPVGRPAAAALRRPLGLRHGAWLAPALTTLLAALLAACASPVVDEAEALSRAGRYEEARLRLDQALRNDPGNAALRTAHAHQTERVVAQALAQAELALAAGRLDEATLLQQRAAALQADPAREHPRLAALKAQLTQARAAQRRQAAERAASAERQAAARQGALQPPALPAALAAAYQKPVTLEFREAPLRQVFEALARSSAINFVFDKDVRGDARVTVFLRNVSLDEALRVILATQQLDRKLLNDSTVLVYPNTPAKQREHQELVTRSLYLANADVKQALTLVRMMTKTRDVHADERLNALVVRDTPEVVRQIERLLATIDLAEPEVTLAVEVMEVASDQVQNLGIDWPATVNIGLPSPATVMGLSGDGVRASIANPGFVASLRASTGSTNLLANPTIRVRNREKAKVQIGNKLPVFSSTSTPSNGATTTTATITYLDVGLKLDVEPNVQLDGDISIKVALEVSNVIAEVSGPGGSLAYNLGTRLTTTALRLHDGETQVLAGLINDEDRRNAKGLPGLATAPFVGRLFGVTGDNRSKTEIVMLITPRIVRPLLPPSAAEATLASGTETMPGSPSLRLRAGASVAMPLATAQGAPAPVSSTPLPEATAPSDGTAALRLAASERTAAGEVLTVTLANAGAAALAGVLSYDASLLQPASTSPGSSPGLARFALPPGGELVLAFRALPGSGGQQTSVRADVQTATGPNGAATTLPLPAEATVQLVPANAAADAPATDPPAADGMPAGNGVPAGDS